MSIDRRRAAALATALCLTTLTLSLSIAPLPATADSYTFDKQQTNITFSWGHLGISRQSARLHLAHLGLARYRL